MAARSSAEVPESVGAAGLTACCPMTMMISSKAYGEEALAEQSVAVAAVAAA